jgi:hypothetical protein
MMELATAFCLSPMLDTEHEPDPEAEELLHDIEKLKRQLDIMFSEDNRQQIVRFIRKIDENRDLYRRTVLLWLDLTEELAYQVELDLGDNTGPVKLKRVEGGVFYLLSKFSEGLTVPRVPRFLNRLVLSLVIRGTVEFIVTLVNIDKHVQRTRVAADMGELGLWNTRLKIERRIEANERKAISKKNVLRRTSHAVREKTTQVLVAVEKQRTTLGERIVNFFLDFLLKPPNVPKAFQEKIDAIVNRMNQQGPTDMPPVRMMGRWFFDIILWIGQHGKELRAAIDVFSIAVHQTTKMSEMTRERRIQVIEDALILYFDELGLNGPYFRFVLRLLVDVNLDAMVFLYKKRGVIDQAPA